MITKKTFKNSNVYIITERKKHMKEIDKLINNDYIIIYDGDVLQENPGTWILANSWQYTNKEYYNIVKTIFPHAHVIYNMAEVGFCSYDWYK
jgi:hypothetical protein